MGKKRKLQLGRDYDGWALKWLKWRDGTPGTPILGYCHRTRDDVFFSRYDLGAQSKLWRQDYRRGLRCVKVKLVEVTEGE